MVDSVILLDSLGFLPTNPVITIFYGQYSTYIKKKVKLLFSSSLSLPLIISVFLPTGKYTCGDEGGNRSNASVWKEDSEDRANLYLREGSWEVLHHQAAQAKWMISSAAYFEFEETLFSKDGISHRNTLFALLILQWQFYLLLLGAKS